MKRFLTFVHVSRFVLSFVLAFALWAWVTNERNPEEAYIARSVPVTVVGLSGSFAATLSVQTVDVTLRGPRSTIDSIDTAAIGASVSLRNVSEPGDYQREVDIASPDGVRRASSSPRSITVTVEQVTEEEFDVVVDLPEDLPRNLRVTEASALPSRVVASGVQADIEAIAQVIAKPTIQGETSSFTTSAELIAVDASNTPISGITFDRPTVNVQLQLEVRGKEIPVFVRCDPCDAAESYEVIGQPQATPATVLVDGPLEALDQVQYIYTTPITTNNITAPTVLGGVLLDVNGLPDGVTVEPVMVDVSVRVEQAIFSRTFANVPVIVLNAPADSRVTVSPVALEVTIMGRTTDLAEIRDQDISVVVDVAGLSLGAHQIEPRIILPRRVTYDDRLPDVLVQINPAPSPTPSPTATTPPAPTATAEPETTALPDAPAQSTP